MTHELTQLRHLIHSGDLYSAEVLADLSQDPIAADYVRQHTSTTTSIPPKRRAAQFSANEYTSPYQTSPSWSDTTNDGNGCGSGFNHRYTDPDGRSYNDINNPQYDKTFFGNGYPPDQQYNTRGYEPTIFSAHTGYPLQHTPKTKNSTAFLHPPQLSDHDIEALPIHLVRLDQEVFLIGHLHTTPDHITLYRPQHIKTRSYHYNQPLTLLIQGNLKYTKLKALPTIIIPHPSLRWSTQCNNTWIDILRSKAFARHSVRKRSRRPRREQQ